MFRPVVLSYDIRRDGMLFPDVEWDRVGWGVPGLCGGRRGSAGGVCGCGGGEDGDVYAGGGGRAGVFDTGGAGVYRRGGGVYGDGNQPDGGTVMTSASAAQSDSASSRARTVEGGTQQVGMTQMASAPRGSSTSTSTSGGSHRGGPAALGLVIAVTAWIAVT